VLWPLPKPGPCVLKLKYCLAASLFLAPIFAAGADIRPRQTPEPGAASSPSAGGADRLLAESDEPPDEPSKGGETEGKGAAGVLDRPESFVRDLLGTPADDGSGMRYTLKLDLEDEDLAERLRGVSTLERKIEEPPRGRAGLIRRLEGDLDGFAAFLKSEGRYAYALSHRIAFDKTPAEIEITVDPGPVYTLASVEIVYDDPTGAGLPSDPAAFGVTTGGPALSEPLVEAPPQLLRLLGEAGYPLAKLRRRTAVVDHAAKAMRVSLEIEEGPRVVFGEVRVVGTDRVEPAYVARVADLEPGGLFDVAKVDAARRRLFSTGLFEGLQIRWPEAPDADGRLAVEIEAQERKRRSVSVGLNYSTTEGAGGDLEWTHRNLLGEDEDLTFTLRAAELKQSARAELAAPNIWRLDQRAFVAGEIAREDTDAYVERRALVETGLSRTYGERWRLGGGGELSIQETDENDETTQNIVLAFPFFATYDGSNDPFDPSRGYKLDFKIEPAAITLDTTDVLATLSAGGSAYRQLTSDRTLIAAARAKSAVIVGPALDRIPASRRLFAGGGGSIRGYQFQSVSPLDADGEPDGGRSLVEFGMELRWRVTEDIGIVPFVDGGAAFDDILPEFDGFQYAAGLGLRYYTPIGPLRLDLAFPLNPRDRDNLFEFYISLGQAF